MKLPKSVTYVFALLFSSNFALGLAPPDDKTIYNTDNRLDMNEVTDPWVLKKADSTVALFYKPQITPIENGKKVKLTLADYATDYNLCKDEPFYSQKTGPFCSGTL